MLGDVSVITYGSLVLPAPVRFVPSVPVAVTNFKYFSSLTVLSSSPESLTYHFVFS